MRGLLILDTCSRICHGSFACGHESGRPTQAPRGCLVPVGAAQAEPGPTLPGPLGGTKPGGVGLFRSDATRAGKERDGWNTRCSESGPSGDS